MTGEQWVYLAILAACTVASGFFSGSETALIGISKERVHRLATESKAGQRVGQLVADPERMLSTLLVANNIVNVLAAAVATTLFIGLIGAQWGPWIATAAVTTVILIFGEITPKTLATRYPERFALTVSPAIWQLSRVLAPLASFFRGITRGLLRLLRIPVEGDSDAVTDADIRALAELGHRDGQIEEVEREIIDALFDLADRPIRDVMTPRVDIVTLSDPVSMDGVRKAVASTGHSRYPVTRGDLDDLLGMLFVKDLVQRSGDPTPDDVASLLRHAHFIPETATILDTLTEMRERKFAIACVVDEHGGIEGIITAKDLLAELVGELQDEYDPGVPAVVRIGPRQWIADGRLPIEDLAEEIDRDLPDGPYSTVAGFFLAVAGHIPEEGDIVHLDGIRLTVVEMDRNRVDRLDVSLI
ncbi:MAG: hemolysin family protein [Actinomycetota bacterium]